VSSQLSSLSSLASGYRRRWPWRASRGEGRRFTVSAPARHRAQCGVLSAVAQPPRGNPRDRPGPAGAGSERLDRSPARSVLRRCDRMGGPLPRRARVKHHRVARPLRGRRLGAPIRVGSPRPCGAARADPSAGVAENAVPAAVPSHRHAWLGRAAATAGATQSEVGSPICELHGRKRDDLGSPGPDRPDRGGEPRPGCRSGSAGRDSPTGVAARVDLSSWISASRTRATRRTAQADYAHADYVE
jgi:hypothetical protein